MSNKPDPVNRTSLGRASQVGVFLGIGGIILFVILWVVLGRLGLTQFPRLFISLCLPPAIIAAIMGIYVLVLNNRSRL